MSKRIRDKSMVPRGNFTYTVKETGAQFSSHVFPTLVIKVRQHMLANNVAVPLNLAVLIEQDYCERMPEYCKDMDAAHIDGETVLTGVVAALAIPAADALHAIGSALGINCQACNTRHRIIRQLKKLGLAETLRRLKGTF